MGPSLQMLWVKLGAFGLAAALGLGAAERTRATYWKRRQQIALQNRAERNLAEFKERSAATEAIRIAVAQLARNSEPCDGLSPEESSPSRTLLHKRVQVTPLPLDRANAESNRADAFEAYTKDISPYGVGLLHEQPVGRGRVMLTFEQPKGQPPISFIADLSWCRPESDRLYSSGGQLVEVAMPAELATTEALEP